MRGVDTNVLVRFLVGDDSQQAARAASLFARATVDMTIKVRLVSCKNGATLWTRSAAREGMVGSVGLDGGVPVFAARDKNEALDELLREIAYQLTWDFRSTRRRL